MPASLGALQLPHAEQAEQQATTAPIPIEPGVFTAAYESLILLLQESRPTIAGILKRKLFTIVHNQWQQQVHGPSEYQLLDDCRDMLLQQLRNTTANASIQLELVLATEADAPPEPRYLTAEERRRRLEELNPHFITFQQRFGTLLN